MRHHFKQPRTISSAEELAMTNVSAPPLDDMIGRRLRRHYEHIEDQPIPDRINCLLEALDRTEASRERRC